MISTLASNPRVQKKWMKTLKIAGEIFFNTRMKGGDLESGMGKNTEF
tara:strand:- start:2605 stop:2745 length:141 start_codon:yes stop_codon:yes gene_type:complete